MSAPSLHLKGRFIITLYSARDLVDKERLFQMSPMCRFNIKGSKEKLESKVSHGTGTKGEWGGEAFILNLEGNEGLFTCEVLDKTTLGHTAIGEFQAELDELNFSGEPIWHKLKSVHNNGKEEGEVCLSFQFEGEGLPEHHRSKKHGRHHPEE